MSQLILVDVTDIVQQLSGYFRLFVFLPFMRLGVTIFNILPLSVLHDDNVTMFLLLDQYLIVIFQI